MNVSVAMATFNGEKYLKEQLDSILCQLDFKDEVIISDDGSTDETLNLLNEYKNDKRVQVIKNPRKGVVSNFDNALRNSNNEVIFLSDQDDIWLPNKVEVVKKCFLNSEKDLVLHNGLIFQDNVDVLNKLLIKKMRHGVMINVLKSCYWGCCMAFKRNLLHHILPFPSHVPAHDQWIGLVAEKRRQSIFLNKPLIMHRVHKNNVSRPLPLSQKLSFRVRLLQSFLNSKGMKD